MAKRRVWEFSKQLAEMRQWHAHPQTRARLRDEQLERIVTAIESVNPKLGVLITATAMLARWEGTSGALAVLDGDSSGWRSLRRACLLNGWSVRIAFGLLDRGDYQAMGKVPIVFNEIALALAQAIVMGEDLFAVWCGTRVLEQLQQREPALLQWDLGPFGPFMMSLYYTWRAKESPLVRPPNSDLGVYAGLFENWNDNTQLASDLIRICDYHKRESFSNEKGYPQFDFNPYPLYPVEILALRRVRSDLGLTTPEVSDPLLDSPLARVPASTGPLEDELISRIRFKALLELPRIGDPW